jgi:3-hydroxyisobutyrate dehydrogenase-like beta-hydroxyacid dehydrogenase
MCKDMAIVSNTLRKVGMNAYVASAASEYFSTAQKRGMSEREGADLIEVVEQATAQNEDEAKSI